MARSPRPRTQPVPRTDGPNQFPNALSAKDRAALGVTCRFLGKTFNEGDLICYQGGEWVCGAEGWAATGKSC